MRDLGTTINPPIELEHLGSKNKPTEHLEHLGQHAGKPLPIRWLNSQGAQDIQVVSNLRARTTRRVFGYIELSGPASGSFPANAL